jgi:hypothetical protein
MDSYQTNVVPLFFISLNLSIAYTPSATPSNYANLSDLKNTLISFSSSIVDGTVYFPSLTNFSTSSSFLLIA